MRRHWRADGGDEVCHLVCGISKTTSQVQLVGRTSSRYSNDSTT
jgi:hypothetical protein